MKTHNKSNEAPAQNRSVIENTSAVPALDDQPASIPADPRFVYFTGPESARNKEGDEIPEWSVYVGDVDQEPVSRVYHVHSFERARALASVMAHDRRLELIAEAQPAVDLHVASQPSAPVAEPAPVQPSATRPSPRKRKAVRLAPQLVAA